jgi:hypothetical protein
MKISATAPLGRAALVAGLALSAVLSSSAQTPSQTVPGAGNGQAQTLAASSELVQSAYLFDLAQAATLTDATLRAQTLDALGNPQTCIHHRANLSAAKKATIVQQLLSAGLLNPADNATFPGGLLAGVFPPVLNDGTACPQLPQPFWSAPGSTFGSHHSYPGGLPVHEANNDTADIDLGAEYRNVYGQQDASGLAFVNGLNIAAPQPLSPQNSGAFLSQDILQGAPLWHDWAKPIVFQWNADGTEFQELSIGGNGQLTDGFNGSAGDARTGGHHILSIAESMARGLSPAFVITQASAHSAPTSGNEFKVVNWIRAAAIIDGIDPIAKGFLTMDGQGNYRLPALREVGQVNLIAAGQTNILTEYELHNLSDADFTFSGPAVAADQTILAQLAPSFGYNPADTAKYNWKFRNVVLSNFSAERLYTAYQAQGLAGVRTEIQILRDRGAL